MLSLTVVAMPIMDEWPLLQKALVKSALISKATRRKDAKNRCVKTES